MPTYSEDGAKPYDRLTAWDKFRGWMHPHQSLIRMKARELEHQFRSGYNDEPRLRKSSGGMFANASKETWRSNRDRLQMIWDARDLVKYEFIGGMIARIVLYVCGKVHCKSDTGVSAIDSAYDEYFHGWCGDEPGEDGLVRCDITGRHRLVKQVQLAFAGFLVDGDAGLVEIDPNLSPNGEYCLQSVEADRIGSPLEQQVQDNYIGGVGIDPEIGRIEFYRVFERTRTNQYKNPQDKPADAFIHVHDPESPDEYRGRSKLVRILNIARDIEEWSGAEMQAGKVQNQWAALVGLKDPFNKTAGDWDKKTDNGTPTQNAEWGKLLRMAEGEVFSMLAPPARPSGAFMDLIQFQLRKLAVALDLPYGFLWDLATLGGVTARIEVQQALRRIEYWQNQVIVDKILNRVRQKVIARGIGLGDLQPHPLWRKASWHFGLSIQTDVAYEAESDIAMATTGIIPIDSVIGKYGHTPREVFRRNAATANAAIEEGAEGEVPVEVIARGLFPDITAQKSAMIEGPVPPPGPGTIEAVGDKGVKLILDLQKNVGEGKVERESAVSTLQHSYGLTKAQAEKLIPEEPSKAKMQLMNPKPAPQGAKVTTTKKTSSKKK